MKSAFIISLFAVLSVPALSRIRCRGHRSLKECYVGGCSNQLCTDKPNAYSTCEWSDAYACYSTATCERQNNGRCGWTSTPDLEECLENPPGSCYVGGCSNQLCTESPNAFSTCEWTNAYACYSNAICERQPDGECGWTPTSELEACLENPPGPTGPCYVGGCSGQLCTDAPGAVSTCWWRPAYACYTNALCERQQATGECGWTNTTELQECLANPPEDPTINDCYVRGCSSELCTSDSNAVSSCEWTPAYACYSTATCAHQESGECGWINTPELQQCLNNASS